MQAATGSLVGNDDLAAAEEARIEREGAGSEQRNRDGSDNGLYGCGTGGMPGGKGRPGGEPTIASDEERACHRREEAEDEEAPGDDADDCERPVLPVGRCT